MINVIQPQLPFWRHMKFKKVERVVNELKDHITNQNTLITTLQENIEKMENAISGMRMTLGKKKKEV